MVMLCSLHLNRITQQGTSYLVDEMSSIKSIALTFVMAAVLFGQIKYITPIPMSGLSLPPPPLPPAAGAIESFLNDQQQEHQSEPPHYNLLQSFKDRGAQQADPRQNYLRELIERLQALEYEERILSQYTPSFEHDYENGAIDFGLNANPIKRSWDKMNGMWGKRAGGDNWNKFRGEYLVVRNLPRHCTNWSRKYVSFVSQDRGASGSRVGII